MATEAPRRASYREELMLNRIALRGLRETICGEGRSSEEILLDEMMEGKVVSQYYEMEQMVSGIFALCRESKKINFFKQRPKEDGITSVPSSGNA